jgi:lipopolysaccharide/colanic/teichoic acid biosynthesis glycosyltransferase
VALDRYYVRRWHFLLDCQILLETLPAILKTKNIM